VYTNLKIGHGLSTIVEFIEKNGLLNENNGK